MARKSVSTVSGRTRRQRKGLPTSPEEAGSAPITKFFKVVESRKSKNSKAQASTPAQKKADTQLTPDQKHSEESNALTLTTPVEDVPLTSSFSSPKPIVCQSSISFKQQNTKKKGIIAPTVGDRVRVFYSNGWDMFGKRKEAGGWWFGSLIAVTKKRKGKGYNVAVLFDDNTSTNFQYPSKVIQRLVSKPEEPNIMYSEQGDSLEHFAYDSKPAILDVGDLVFCLYQNGKERGAWFRGRIAHVNEMKTHCDVAYDDGDYECGVPLRKGYIVLVQDGSQHLGWLEGVHAKLTKKGATRKSTARLKLIAGGVTPRLLVEWSTGPPEEEAYSDVVKNLFNVAKMEKEKILTWPERAFKLIASPNEKQKIHRIPPETDQGRPVEETTTLKPIETKTKITGNPQKANDERAHPSLPPRVAKTEKIAEDSPVTQVVKKIRPRPTETEKAHEKVPYSPVLKRLRSRTRTTEAESASTAVATQIDTELEGREHRAGPAQTATAIDKMSSPRVLKTLSIRSTKNHAAAKNASTTSVLKRPRSQQVQGGTAAEKLSPAQALKTSGALPTETDTSASSSKRLKVQDCVRREANESGPLVALPSLGEGQAIPVSDRKEMNSSMTSSFWKALNTPEPHYGADILQRLTTIQGLLPSQNLCRSLIEMLTMGPTNGSVRFPDCNRVENGRRYVAFLLKQPCMTDNFGRSSKVSFWSEWLDELSDLVYCVDSDEERTSSAALCRIGQSLHLKSCGLWLLSSLLSQSLRQMKDNGDEFSSTRLKPVVRDFVGSQRRQSDALKNAIRATMWMWTTFGHYLSSQLKFPQPKDADSVQASATDIHVVVNEFRSIVFKLGEICSFLAVFESMENDSDISECKYKIRDTVEVELRKSKFDATVFLGAPKAKRQRSSILAKHQKYIKLQFLLTLKGDYVGKLREELADMFEVEEEFSLLS